jgi:flagellar M-ring protein FliF
VRRLSIAVVVDDQQIVDPQAGTVTYQPWSAEDLARFTRLVQDAVGFDASRGDSVSVVNTPFVADRGDVIEEIPFYAQPWFWDVAKQIIGALFILALVFGVLRPLLNNVTGNKKGSGKDLVPLERDLQPLATELDDDQLSLSGSAQQIMLANPNDSFEAQLNAIKNLVAENPARVAEVVKEWINGDE